MVARLFEPLGWQVEVVGPPLDPGVPGWGRSRYADVRLTGTLTVSEALRHLYVLLPALDGGKHYWVGPDEVDKLVRAAGEWLGDHPERDWILRRSLAHRREYVTDAVERLGVTDAAGRRPPTRRPSVPCPRSGGRSCWPSSGRRGRRRSSTWGAARGRCCASCSRTRRSRG